MKRKQSTEAAVAQQLGQQTSQLMNLFPSPTGMVWYGILGFNVPLDTI